MSSRPTRERVDQLVQWHGFDGCERLITELPPDNHDRQMCELALEVLALRVELEQFRGALADEITSRLPTPAEVEAFTQLMDKARKDLTTFRTAFRREMLGDDGKKS